MDCPFASLRKRGSTGLKGMSADYTHSLTPVAFEERPCSPWNDSMKIGYRISPMHLLSS